MDNELKNESLNYKSWVLNERQICDLEMILNGGFAPLNCFSIEVITKVYYQVCV